MGDLAQKVTSVLSASSGDLIDTPATSSAVKIYSIKTDKNKSLSTHFTVEEFASKDGADEVKIDTKLVSYLEKIRTYFGKPTVINSGYRTPEHNAKVGGVKDSYHVKGMAADICVQGVASKDVALYAESLKIGGIGWYEKQNFVHIDTRSGSVRWKDNGNNVVKTFGSNTPISKTTTQSSTITETSIEKIIWDYLYKKLNNIYGTAGLMGNLYAESALNPINLQNTYEKKLNMSDKEYTKAVDNGTYTNFIRDSAGYGLAQWTYWSRKENLLKFAKSTGKSIGDLQMQLDFLWKELSTVYKTVVSGLKTAKSVKEASDVVITKFEKPKNQSEENKKRRALIGQKFYDKYAVLYHKQKLKCSYIEPTKVIQFNSKGNDVKWVQWYLVQLGFKISIDGDFGNITKKAVMEFQQKYNLNKDGIVGNITRSKLKSIYLNQ